MELYYGKWYFGIQWDKISSIPDRYAKYLDINWLIPKARFWGYREEWYDGPLRTFGFWFFNVGWGLW
jgi:hypothetical protein